MFKIDVDVWRTTRTWIDEQLAVLTGQLGIPVENICVGGSAALVIMQVRDNARDVNVWVDSPYFERLAEDHKVLVHPLRDSVVRIPDTDVYVRRRNRYFKSHMLHHSNVEIFDEMALLIQKRSSYIEPGRPDEQKQKDWRDIRILNEILATRNKVAS
jgi:hypothetical protein